MRVRNYGEPLEDSWLKSGWVDTMELVYTSHCPHRVFNESVEGTMTPTITFYENPMDKILTPSLEVLRISTEAGVSKDTAAKWIFKLYKYATELTAEQRATLVKTLSQNRNAAEAKKLARAIQIQENGVTIYYLCKCSKQSRDTVKRYLKKNRSEDAGPISELEADGIIEDLIREAKRRAKRDEERASKNLSNPNG